MSTIYYKLQFSIVEQDNKDILIALLNTQGFDSFLETETGLEGYIPKKFYEQNGVDFTMIKDIFGNKIEISAPEEMPNINWNLEWEKNYDPVFINDICIRADFHDPQPHALYEIIINPKMSFGTGHHDTTKLILSTLTKLFNSIETHSTLSFLDYGTGTGILAIYAALRGLKVIEACDIDPSAIETTQENYALNGISCIKTYLGGIESMRQTYDIIVANINKNTIIETLPSVQEKLNKHGHLLLSGFFQKDVDAISEVIHKNNLTVMAIECQNSWCCLEVKK